MLTRVVRQLTQQNRSLLLAVLSSRATNAMACRNLPSSTTSGAPHPKKIDLSNIQDAIDLSNIQDAGGYTGFVIQGFQGDPVDPADGFSTGWAKGIMDQAMSATRESHQERLDNRQQGVQGDIEPSPSSADKSTTTVSTDSYRTEPTVSLYSVMQSQVPKPYGRDPTHLNMPGASVMRQRKYLSGMLHDVHPSRRLSTAIRWQADRIRDLGQGAVGVRVSNLAERCVNPDRARSYSGSLSGAAAGGSSGSGGNHTDGKKMSQKDRLKRAVKEYGATVVVFHVCISLASLGGFYLAVSSGIDVISILQAAGVGESLLSSRVATGASTFVIAYAVHKVFAPVRIAVTLTSAPFIVRYLRLKGVLRAPKAN